MKNRVKKEEDSLLEEKRGYKLSLYKRSYRWIILLGLLISQIESNKCGAAGLWPMFQHDQQRSGRSDAIGIQQPILKWSYFTNSYIFASPVIDNLGKWVYLVTEDGHLHIISTSSGKKEQVVSLGDKTNSTPAVSKEGNIYVALNNGQVICFDSSFKSQWVYLTKSTIKSSSLAIDDDGTIFIGCEDGTLHAINKDGSPKWVSQTTSSILTSPAITDEGIIYVGCADGSLYAINKDGSLRFKKEIKISAFSSPVVDSSGNVYVGCANSTVVVISKDGKDLLSIPLESPIYSLPVIGKDGSIFIGSEEGLYGITSNGIWCAKTGRIFNSAPAISSDGIVYVASFEGKIYAIEPQKGEIIWSYDIGLGPTSLAIDQDTIYVGTRDRNLYAIGSSQKPEIHKVGKKVKEIKEEKQVEKLKKVEEVKKVEKVERVEEVEKVEVIEKKVKITPPASPSNLVATSVSAQEIMIGWQDNADNEDGYRIYRKIKDKEEYTLIKVLPVNATSFLDTTLTPETTYLYRVVAYNKMGFSQYSVQGEWTTKSLLPPKEPEKEVVSPTPLPPKEPEKQVVSPTPLPPKEPEKPKVSPTPLPPKKPKKPIVSPTPLPPKPPTALKGEAVPSTQITLPPPPTPPTAPTNLQVSVISQTSAKLTWSDNSNNEEGFKIERALPLQEYVQLKVLPPNTTSYIDEGLKKDTTYYYRIRAYNKMASSDYSDVVGIRTLDVLPAPPTNLTGVSDISTRIKLSWQDNSKNEAGFKIERRLKSESAWTQIDILDSNVTSYEDCNLIPGTAYCYRVRAFNRAGNSESSNLLSITTLPILPFVPTGLKANPISSSQINLSWSDNSNNESGFRLERKTEGKDYQEIYILGANVTAYEDKYLEPNTTYSYRIRAYNQGGNSSYSNEQAATTKDIIPYPPSNLLAKATSTTQINLCWQDNSKNEQGFKIERSKDGEVYTSIAILTANTTTYQDNDLIPNTTYYYRVRAYNVLGDSDYSNKIECKTLDIIPSAPTNLRALFLPPDKVNLKWQDISNNEAGFKIERKEKDGSYTQVSEVSKDITEYAEGGLVPKNTYVYRIRAYNKEGDSPYSNEALVKIIEEVPSAPTNLSAKPISQNEIELTWQDTSNNELGFEINRKGYGDKEWTQVFVTSANTTSYQDGQLSPDTVYYYCVKAYNQAGDSNYSNVVTAKTSPAPPVPFKPIVSGKSIYTGITSPKLSWTYMTKGRIYRSNPLVDTKERCYIGSEDANLYCLSSAGKLLWCYPTQGEITTSAAIGQDGEIYVVSADQNLYALLPDGTLKWKYPVKFPIKVPPVIAPNFAINVFTWNGKVYSLHPDGRLRWTGYIGGGTIDYTPVIDTNGNIYIGAGGVDGGLFCLDSNGSIKWKYTDGGEASTSPAIDTNGNIYIGLNNTLYSFNPQGGMRFKIEHERGSWMKFAPIITADGIIYYNLCWSSQEGNLRAVEQNGKILWEYPIGWSELSPIIDFTGNIYVISKNYNLSCISSEGKLIWNYTFDSNITTSPNIGQDGTIYVGVNNGQLYALGKGDKPPDTPCSLIAEAISNSQINLNWIDNSKDESGFIIERGSQDESYSQLALLPFNTTSYQDKGLLPITTYYYRIKAVNKNGSSGYSNSASAKTLKLPPKLLTQVSIIPLKGGGKLKLTWQKPEQEAFSFSHVQIYRSIVRGTIGTLIADEIKETTYVDTDLVNDLPYYYTFVVFDIYGNKSVPDVQYIGVPKDNILPQIINYTPTGNNISPEASITITFNEKMDNESVIQAFSIHPAVIGTFTWEGNRLIFKPLSDLTGNTNYKISISNQARDISGNYIEKPFIWQFTVFNPSPIIWFYTPINLSPSLFEGESLSFEVSASDPNDDEIRYSWKLDGVEKSTTSSWLYKPGENDAGVKTLILTVTDGVSAVIQNWTITVIDKNIPPILSVIKDTIINVNELLQFNVSAFDADSDPLTYTTSSLPAGATFSQKTKIFSWRPTEKQTGTYQVTFKVSDGKGGEDTRKVEIRVNQPPVLK